MGEEKEKLDRLRAKRGGHRTVVTKNINEARNILEHTDLEDIMLSRLNVVEEILDEKLILLARFDEEITKICSVDHIEEEIEVADEIRSRILQTKGEITIARARVKNGGTSSSSSWNGATGLRLLFVCQRKTKVFVSVGISRCPLTGFF